MAGFPYEPVIGSYLPVCFCGDCGKSMVDTEFMRDWYRQDWPCGFHDKSEHPAFHYGYLDEFREYRYLWGYRVDLCGKCSRQRIKDHEKKQYMRNCCVCGDPFLLYSNRPASYHTRKTTEVTCTKKGCAIRAHKAFTTTSTQYINPTWLHRLCEDAVRNGKFHVAQIAFATCELLFLTKRNQLNTKR